MLRPISSSPPTSPIILPGQSLPQAVEGGSPQAKPVTLYSSPAQPLIQGWVYDSNQTKPSPSLRNLRTQAGEGDVFSLLACAPKDVDSPCTKPMSTGENKVTAQHLGSPGSSLPKAWVLGLLFLWVIKLHPPLLLDTCRVGHRLLITFNFKVDPDSKHFWLIW